MKTDENIKRLLNINPSTPVPIFFLLSTPWSAKKPRHAKQSISNLTLLSGGADLTILTIHHEIRKVEGASMENDNIKYLIQKIYSDADNALHKFTYAHCSLIIILWFSLPMACFLCHQIMIKYHNCVCVQCWKPVNFICADWCRTDIIAGPSASDTKFFVMCIWSDGEFDWLIGTEWRICTSTI